MIGKALKSDVALKQRILEMLEVEKPLDLDDSESKIYDKILDDLRVHYAEIYAISHTMVELISYVKP